MNKLCFKAFGKSLIDIVRAKSEDNVERPFGEKVLVLEVDFKQILSL